SGGSNVLRVTTPPTRKKPAKLTASDGRGSPAIRRHDVAQRPIWRGHLRLALVSCPVALFSAKHDRSTIRFNLINPETGHRIRMLTVDGETDKEVQRRDLVKGYEFKKDHYLLLTDADFDSVKVESSSVMAVEKFVDAASIDPLYYDTAYYV